MLRTQVSEALISLIGSTWWRHRSFKYVPNWGPLTTSWVLDERTCQTFEPDEGLDGTETLLFYGFILIQINRGQF